MKKEDVKEIEKEVVENIEDELEEVLKEKRNYVLIEKFVKKEGNKIIKGSERSEGKGNLEDFYNIIERSILEEKEISLKIVKVK